MMRRKILLLFLSLTFLSCWQAHRTDARVVVNEFMASNDTTVADEAGQFEDWVELYNTGDVAVQLAGWHLTDDFSKLEKWTFPDTTIEPGGFLLIWCDNDPEDGPLHATFKLNADGEQIALVDPDGGIVDSLSFGPQQTDVSRGRVPDGSPNWQVLTQPTPGRSNTTTNVAAGGPGLPPARYVLRVFPNPVHQRDGFLTLICGAALWNGNARVEVYDVLGRRLNAGSVAVLRGRVRLPIGRILARAVPGVYFVRLHFRDKVQSSRLTVLP